MTRPRSRVSAGTRTERTISVSRSTPKAISTPVSTSATSWRCPRRSSYLLRISSGAVRVSLEEDASINAKRPHGGDLAETPAGVTAALNVVLDGVASRAVG